MATLCSRRRARHILARTQSLMSGLMRISVNPSQSRRRWATWRRCVRCTDLRREPCACLVKCVVALLMFLFRSLIRLHVRAFRRHAHCLTLRSTICWPFTRCTMTTTPTTPPPPRARRRALSTAIASNRRRCIDSLPIDCCWCVMSLFSPPKFTSGVALAKIVICRRRRRDNVSSRRNECCCR